MLYICYLIYFATKIFPPEILYFFWWFLHFPFFIFNFKKRKIVIDNLKNFINTDFNKTARKIFLNFGYYLIDFFYANYLIKNQRIKAKGLENLDYCLNQKKGVVLVTFHLGNWELGGMFLAQKGYPLNVLYLPHQDKRLDNLFKEMRIRAKEKIIPLKQLKKCFYALKNKEILAILGDINFTKNSKNEIKVRFFNQDFYLPSGPAEFALRSDSYLLIGIATISKRGRYELNIFPPLSGSTSQELTQQISKSLEKIVSQYVEQWYIFYPW